MLKKVRFANFKSFVEETTIDFAPSKIEYLSQSNIYDGVLKGVAFYGQNASGKTNALLAITLLLDLLFKDGPIINANTFSVFSSGKKMFFEYTFCFDGDEIVYSFEADREKGFTKENLFENGAVLLDRVLTSAKSYVTENPDYEGIDPSALFIRSIYFNTRFAGHPTLVKWFAFLQSSIYYNPVRSYAQLVSFDNKNMQEIYLEPFLAKHGPGEINAFLNEFGFPFNIDYDESPVNAVTPFQMRLKVVRPNLKPIPFFMESMGNQMLLGFLPAFLSVVKQGGILAIDEFSSGLHNELEELLVSYFYRHSGRAQIVFVSHSTNLLKTSLIRPDQVYSVEFGEHGSSLVKFSEYGMRESQNMEKMYLAGAFGGLPLYHA